MKKEAFRRMYNKCVPDKAVTSRLIRAVEEADAESYAARHSSGDSSDIEDHMCRSVPVKRKISPAMYAAAAVIFIFGGAVFLANRETGITSFEGAYESTDTAPADMAGYQGKLPVGEGDVIIHPDGSEGSGYGAADGSGAVVGENVFGISPLSGKSPEDITLGDMLEIYGHVASGEGVDVMLFSGGAAFEYETLTAPGMDGEMIFSLLSEFSDSKQEVLPVSDEAVPEVIIPVRYNKDDPEQQAVFRVYRYGISVSSYAGNDYIGFDFGCNSYDLFDELWDMAEKQAGNVTFGSLFDKYGHDSTGEGIELTLMEGGTAANGEQSTVLVKNCEMIYDLLSKFSDCKQTAKHPPTYYEQEVILTVRYDETDPERWALIHVDRNGITLEFSHVSGEYPFACDAFGLLNELWDMAKPDSGSVTLGSLLDRYGKDDSGKGVKLTYFNDSASCIVTKEITSPDTDELLGMLRKYSGGNMGLMPDHASHQPSVELAFCYLYAENYPVRNSDYDETMYVKVFPDGIEVSFAHSTQSYVFGLDSGELFDALWEMGENGKLPPDSSVNYSSGKYAGTTVIGDVTEYLYTYAGKTAAVEVYEDGVSQSYNVDISRVMAVLDSTHSMVVKVEKPYYNENADRVTVHISDNAAIYIYPDRINFVIPDDGEFSCAANRYYLYDPMINLAVNGIGADISMTAFEDMTEEEIAKALTGLPFDDVNEALGGYDGELSGMYGYVYELEGDSYLTVYLTRDRTISDVLLDSAEGQTDISRQFLSKMSEEEISGLLTGMSINEVNAMLGSFDRELSKCNGFTYDLGNKKLLTLYRDKDNIITLAQVTNDLGFDRDDLLQMTDEDIQKLLTGLDFDDVEIALGGSDTDIYGNMQYSSGVYRCGYREIFTTAKLGGSITEITITPKFMWCVPAVRHITDGYGERYYEDIESSDFHKGIDISAPDCAGAEIAAAADGTVLTASDAGDGYGIHVVIDHGGKVTTLYAHMSDCTVSVGDKVKMGQVIGYIGSSGQAYGDQCHFEVSIDGEQVDPMDYVSVPK